MRKDYRDFDTDKVILVTGAAGFIGFHLSKALLEMGYKIVGYDNLNDYYDVKLKEDRLDILRQFDKFSFIKGDLADEGFVILIQRRNLAKSENIYLEICLKQLGRQQ